MLTGVPIVDPSTGSMIRNSLSSREIEYSCDAATCSGTTTSPQNRRATASRICPIAPPSCLPAFRAFRDLSVDHLTPDKIAAAAYRRTVILKPRSNSSQVNSSVPASAVASSGWVEADCPISEFPRGHWWALWPCNASLKPSGGIHRLPSQRGARTRHIATVFLKPVSLDIE